MTHNVGESGSFKRIGLQESRRIKMANPDRAWKRLSELDRDGGDSDSHMLATALVQLDESTDSLVHRVRALEEKVKHLEELVGNIGPM